MRQAHAPVEEHERDMLGDLDIGARPTLIEEGSSGRALPGGPLVPPPRAAPQPEFDASSETDAMMLAAVRPYGHEEPHEVRRREFESPVREGSYEEDTLEDFPTVSQEEGSKASSSSVCGTAVRNFSGRSFPQSHSFTKILSALTLLKDLTVFVL